MEFVRRLHAQDLAAGYAGTFLPRQLEKKYKNAGKEFIWQWFFPAPTLHKSFPGAAPEPPRSTSGRGPEVLRGGSGWTPAGLAISRR